MLILQFLEAIEGLNDRLGDAEELHVYLVIRNRTQFELAAGTFLDLLMQARSKMVSVKMNKTGVSILDRFANRMLADTNEDWAKWQLCRYAEIAIEIMCYGISRAINPLTTPESLFEEGRAPAFGLFLQTAKHLAGSSKLDSGTWGARLFGQVLQERTSADALDEINHQRNNLAHGRQSLPLTEIKKLVDQGLNLDSWERISETDGELRLDDWWPWVGIAPTGDGQIGLFERWQNDSTRYLVPETGEIFKIQRKV